MEIFKNFRLFLLYKTSLIWRNTSLSSSCFSQKIRAYIDVHKIVVFFEFYLASVDWRRKLFFKCVLTETSGSHCSEAGSLCRCWLGKGKGKVKHITLVFGVVDPDPHGALILEAWSGSRSHTWGKSWIRIHTKLIRIRNPIYFFLSFEIIPIYGKPVPTTQREERPRYVRDVDYIV